MKNTLWTFGDSMTFGHGCNDLCPSDTRIEYLPFKKEGDDVWPNHLAKLLNYNLNNLGLSGASNEYIIDSIIDNFDKIKENDVVVINSTLYGRMEIPYLDGTYNILSGYEKNKISIDEKDYIKSIMPKIDDEEKIQTLVNFQYHFSNHYFYKDRYRKRFDFIKKRLLSEIKLKFLYMWSLEDDDAVYTSFETIKTATNGVVNDTHFSFNGHFNFAHFLYAYMDNKRMI